MRLLVWSRLGLDRFSVHCYGGGFGGDICWREAFIGRGTFMLHGNFFFHHILLLGDLLLLRLLLA